MKKKILALVCDMTMVFGMSLSVCASNSATAGGVAGGATGKPSADAGAVSNNAATSTPGSTEQLVTSGDNAMGQTFTVADLGYFAETTTVSGVAGATLKPVSANTAKAMIAQARTIAGAGTFIAAIVDLEVPAGTGTATFTLTCPNVWKGQNVTILHQKSDGSFENITPGSVEDNKVTFTMTSYSPVAIVINTGAKSPKTGDIILVVAAMAALSGLGAAVCTRKAKKN